MVSTATSAQEYMDALPEERKVAIQQLRKDILKSIPKGFVEEISYGMIGYVVPHNIYKSGYHCNPSLPLPFMNIASQKNFIAIYHMGIFADEKLMNWFKEEYMKVCKGKLDMGKSCIRFKKMEDIPFKLIAELSQKMTPKQWIELYENAFLKK